MQTMKELTVGLQIRDVLIKPKIGQEALCSSAAMRCDYSHLVEGLSLFHSPSLYDYRPFIHYLFLGCFLLFTDKQKQ